MLKLKYDTPTQWLSCVEAHLDQFLQDHAANERKVSASALKLVVQHPGRPDLVRALIDIAKEELDHFDRVYRILCKRGLGLAQDAPDPYIGGFRKAISNPDMDAYLLDRLVTFGIIEARGCERFSILGEGLADAELREFYQELTRSEAQHHATYHRLARKYFPEERVRERQEYLLGLEADILSRLPLRPALY